MNYPVRKKDFIASVNAPVECGGDGSENPKNYFGDSGNVVRVIVSLRPKPTRNSKQKVEARVHPILLTMISVVWRGG
jgi:hypothetical protein